MLIGVVTFVIWSYMSYFQLQGKTIETSQHALEAAQDTKVLLEARDRAMLDIEKNTKSGVLEY